MGALIVHENRPTQVQGSLLLEKLALHTLRPVAIILAVGVALAAVVVGLLASRNIVPVKAAGGCLVAFGLSEATLLLFITLLCEKPARVEVVEHAPINPRGFYVDDDWEHGSNYSGDEIDIQLGEDPGY